MKDYCSSLEAMFYVQGNKSIIFQSSLSKDQLSVICLLFSSVVRVIYFSPLFSTAKCLHELSFRFY